ncbi:Na+/galactose cotransporter [Niastella yeongjuensis]|uniref:Na+/galactose cotransporter n=1 Tax=Niastella yeongjuensis TaxID=354355 RepID=A0A1V9ENT2_9BACT|nr:sodium:solute symporter family protein [Niastella yeongjuensis]OQP47741.1 Na+/galactose cotransporter [Niastella yeongjuensis]SEP45576.1 solute:Na+ symporter, SSS family [Niastella yeongjuensis]
MSLHFADYLIILVYFIFVIGVGFLIKKKIKSSNDFLTSSRSIPLWITSLAFISANLGAQEVIGMVASGAKYGIMTVHFYWVGAIFAMVFLGVFMMPFYYGSRARSVPEYLSLRFDEKTRGLNAISFAVMTVFSSGISLYALAKLMETILHWDFDISIWVSAGIVMVYTFLGGLTSAVYNEVLQFFLIVLGLSPLVIIALQDAGGWDNIKALLQPEMTHAWKYMGNANDNPMGLHFMSLIFGLGFVMSFGYWCTDFLVVQRAMIAKNMGDAQRTPIIAAIPKMMMPLIVVLPGIIAITLMQPALLSKGYHIPTAANGELDYTMTLPSLIAHYYPTGILGVGITALIASFMSGMAGNVTAFNSVFTFDIYQSYFVKNKSDRHYLLVGKGVTVVGILISIVTAYIAKSFNNINDFLQLVFGFVNGPLFATFLLGMFWKRATGHGAFWGLVAGTAAAAITHGVTVAEGKGGWIAPLYTIKSGMGQAFIVAAISWIFNFFTTIFVSLVTKPKPDEQLKGLVYSLTEKPKYHQQKWYLRVVPLGLLLLAITILLNFIFF